MKRFTLKALPYPYDALEPVISARTLQIHHDKHHGGYVDRLNRLVEGTSFEHMDLDMLTLQARTATKQQALYNNAAQVWNHDFLWQSLAPNGGGQPPESVAKRLDHQFGSVDAFRKEFATMALSHFGSGWVWLVVSPSGQLAIAATHDADNPLLWGAFPVFTCDLWEHAYYLDYQQDRAHYVQAVLDRLINWAFVASRIALKLERHAA